MRAKSSQPKPLANSPGWLAYQRHKPEETALYRIIEQNLPSFQSHLSSADISLPGFVHKEFHSYLRCGFLKHGFLGLDEASQQRNRSPPSTGLVDQSTPLF